MLTADPQWRSLRGKRTRNSSRVERTDEVRVGGTLFALLFVDNPSLDRRGQADVTCDVRMIRPNGRVSVHRGLTALRRNLGRTAAGTYLAEFVLTMVGEEKDPTGEWVLEYVVHDRNRGVEVPVVGRYELLPENANR